MERNNRKRSICGTDIMKYYKFIYGKRGWPDELRREDEARRCLREALWHNPKHEEALRLKERLSGTTRHPG